MKKWAIISLIAILILSGLSGCVGNKSGSSSNETQSTGNSAGIQTDSKSDKEEEIGTNVKEIGVSSSDTTTTTTNGSAEWCVPGDKVTINEDEFTVVGIVTYTGKDGDVHDGVCKAEKITEGGNSVKYFSQDRSFIAAESKSSGKNARAEAIAIVKK